MATGYSIFKTTDDDAEGAKSDGVAVTGTEVYYSYPWSAAVDGQALQLEWTGTPTGTFTLWWSSKPKPDMDTDDDWVEDVDFDPDNPAGTDGDWGAGTGAIVALLKRVKYTNASGDGVLKGWVTGS